MYFWGGKHLISFGIFQSFFPGFALHDKIFAKKRRQKKKTQNTKSEEIAEEQKQKPVDQKQGNFTSGKVTLHPTLITRGWPFSSQDLIVDSPL